MKNRMLDTFAVVIVVARLLYLISEQAFANAVDAVRPRLAIPKAVWILRLRRCRYCVMLFLSR